jgi:transposase
MLAALDLTTGQIIYRIHHGKRWQELLAFLKVLRARYLDQRLYIVLDNFSPHRRQEVRGWCDEHDVELVFLPTYASWLNWIESEFAALRYFTLNGADYASHAEQNVAIRGYIRWRNTRARPKRHFAINSKIRRTPDISHYPPNVA